MWDDLILYTSRTYYQKNYQEREGSTEEEMTRIIKLAASLIKAEIRGHEYSNEVYPNPAEIKELNWIPPLLR